MKNKKKIFEIFLVIILSILIYSGFYFIIFPYLSDAYNASDIIGQTDQSSSNDYQKDQKNNAIPTNKVFNSPYNIAIDSANHRLFVADYSNSRVLVYNLNASNDLLDQNADYVLGQTNFYNTVKGISQNQIYTTKAVAYDSNTNYLYVADSYNNRVLVFDVSAITNGENALYVLGQLSFTSATAAASATGMDDPSGLAIDSANSRLFVADNDNNRILVYDVSTITNGQAAVNVLGQADFTSAGAATSQAGLKGPSGLEYDSVNDLLYVADYSNNRILIYDVAVINDGENAINVLGQADFTSAGSATTQSGLNNPRHIELDSVNNYLYVADMSNSRVVIFDVTVINDGENAINVLGQSDFTSNNTATTQSGMNYPSSALINSTTNTLYVTDQSNHRILLFDVTAINDGENASNVMGQYDSGDNPRYNTGYINNTPISAIGFNYPVEIELDTVNHRLFVADELNYRVLVFNLNSDNTLSDKTADYVLAQADFSSNSTGLTQSTISDPISMEFDSTNNRLFLGDRSNDRILVFDTSSITNGKNAINVFGQSDFTSSGHTLTANSFYGPTGLYYDETNSALYVNDLNYCRILKFDLSDGITDNENAVNVLGQANFTSSSCSVSQNRLNYSHDLAYDTDNDLIFTIGPIDHRVIAYDLSDGLVDGENAAYVLGQPDFTTSSADTNQQGFNKPYDGFYDSTYKRLYISDTYNHRILVFDSSDGYTNNESAVAVLGQDDYTTSDRAYNAGQDKLLYPRDMEFDAQNNCLWVADFSNHRLVKYNFVKPATDPYTDGTIGQTYSSAALTSTNSQGTVTYSISSGMLPTGLNLDANSGAISGDPIQEGTFSFTVRATDTTANSTFIGDKDYDIIINAAPGGGGLPSKAFDKPEEPESGFSIDVKGGAITLDPKITLILNGGEDVTKMAISNNKNFEGAGIIDFSDEYEWDICSEKEKCDYGRYKVYTKFYTEFGQASEIVSVLIEYVEEKPDIEIIEPEIGGPDPEDAKRLAEVYQDYRKENPLPIKTPIIEEQPISEPEPIKTLFNQFLYLGSIGDQVKNLQAVLKELGYFAFDRITGYFGPITRQSVIKFQQDNIEILKKAPGWVGPMTRQVLNELINENDFKNLILSEEPRFTRYLHIGSTGDEVKALQLKLKQLGYYKMEIITGFYDEITKQAVIDFQKDNIEFTKTAPGWVGPYTRELLNKMN